MTTTTPIMGSTSRRLGVVGSSCRRPKTKTTMTIMAVVVVAVAAQKSGFCCEGLRLTTNLAASATRTKRHDFGRRVLLGRSSHPFAVVPVVASATTARSKSTRAATS